LYRDGQFVRKIAIGEVVQNPSGKPGSGKGIKPLPENFTSFELFIKDFSSHIGLTIKSSKKLARNDGCQSPTCYQM
jgi:hypothetical protein